RRAVAAVGSPRLTPCGFRRAEDQILQERSADPPHGAPSFPKRSSGMWRRDSGWPGLSLQSPGCRRLLGFRGPSESSHHNLLAASAPAPAPPRAAFGRASTSPEWASRGRAKIEDRGSRIEDGGSRIPEQNCSDLPFPYPCAYPILHPRPSILDPPSSILDPR